MNRKKCVTYVTEHNCIYINYRRPVIIFYANIINSWMKQLNMKSESIFEKVFE